MILGVKISRVEGKLLYRDFGSNSCLFGLQFIISLYIYEHKVQMFHNKFAF